MVLSRVGSGRRGVIADDDFCGGEPPLPEDCHEEPGVEQKQNTVMHG